MIKKELTNGWEEIITPYLDIHNDLISIYVKCYEGGYIISDQGYTIEDLEFSGCTINKSDNRGKLLQLALNGFGVQLNDANELFIHASFENFSIKNITLSKQYYQLLISF